MFRMCMNMYNTMLIFVTISSSSMDQFDRYLMGWNMMLTNMRCVNTHYRITKPTHSNPHTRAMLATVIYQFLQCRVVFIMCRTMGVGRVGRLRVRARVRSLTDIHFKSLHPCAGGAVFIALCSIEIESNDVIAVHITTHHQGSNRRALKVDYR